VTYDYSTLENTGLSLITKFGRDVVLKRIAEGVYNPNTGAISGNSEVNETIKAVFTNFKDNQIDGSIVLRGDRLVLMSAKDITPPQTNDMIGGFKIVGITHVQTGDTPILYKLQVRK